MNSLHSSLADPIPSWKPGLAFHPWREAGSAHSETDVKTDGWSSDRSSRAIRKPGTLRLVDVSQAVQRSMNSSSLPACTCHRPEAQFDPSIAVSFQISSGSRHSEPISVAIGGPRETTVDDK